MLKRLALGLAMLAAGAVLLVASSFAAPSRSHGIFRLAVVGPGDTMDPQVTYNTLTWSLEYATAAKLVNFPDKGGQAGALLVPEVARSYRVSKDGTQYTFLIRRGLRFSDGTRVTGKSFAYAFDRVLSPNLDSPGKAFISNVVSYKGTRKRFVVHLSGPYPTFLLTMTMPFFQATSPKLPLDQEVTSGPIPSAGPYSVTAHDPGTTTELRRNHYYRGSRPHHLKGMEVSYNQNALDSYLETLAGQFDEGPVPADQVETVADRFGVNRTQFWAKPTTCVNYIAFNTEGGLLQGNAAMRRAINWALNRKAYNAPPESPPFVRSSWTHLLGPGVPGVITKRKLQPFTPGPNLKRARKLAHGHFGSGKLTIFYRTSGIFGPWQKKRAVRTLRRIGFKTKNLNLVGFPGVDIYDALGNRSDWDLGLSVGFCTDGLDPAAVFDSSFIHIANPKYRAKIEAAKKLRGNARLRAFGRLDLTIMRKVAPVAPVGLYNNLYLFSQRVRPHSLVYQPIYTDWDLAAIQVK
jgi:ABC-type oligopeptide transport system substrate-binding subunit